MLRKEMFLTNNMHSDSEEHFQAICGNYKFNVSVSIKDQRGIYNTYTVFVGGMKKGCVQITGQTQPTNERYQQVIDHTIAHIASITYNERCSIEKELEKGTGTRQMLKLAMNVVKQRFNVSKFTLDDKSYFACESYNISLAHVNVALYGETWYERNFKAIVFDGSLHAIYKSRVIRLNDSANYLPYDLFIQKYKVPDKPGLAKIYNSCKTYNQFFTTLKAIYPTYCELIHGWVENFVTTELLNFSLNQKWLIQNIPHVIWHEVPLVNSPQYNTKQVGGTLTRHCIGVDWRLL